MAADKRPVLTIAWARYYKSSQYNHTHLVNFHNYQLFTTLNLFKPFTMPSKRTTKPEEPVASDTTEPTNTNTTEATSADTGPSTPVTQRQYQHHHRHHNHRASNSNDDLSSWTDISLDRTGATLRTVCTTTDEQGSTWERRYHHIPRVDEPMVHITHEKIKAMEDEDGMAEREVEFEDGDEEWVLIEK